MSTRRRRPNAVSLVRHFVVRGRLRASYWMEHMTGWRLFLLWTPRLMSSALRGCFKRGFAQSSIPTGDFVNDFADLPAYYINLDSRPDRNDETLTEFERLKLRSPVRYPAALHSNGGLGCSISHRNLVQLLLDNGSGLTMICEDDVEFVFEGREFSTILKEFQERKHLGVLCLAYRLRGPRLPISRQLSVSNNIQMAACYVVKPFALRPLLRSFESSVSHLRDGAPYKTFALDQLWKRVQTREVFFCIPRTPMARQRRSFSNIALTTKFYG